jgi:CubicO group peptidase (beta-lactamase class C family)
MRLVGVWVAISAALGLGVSSAHAQPTPAAIDSVFARYSASTPGCNIGVERASQAPLIRAYGSADLEHGVLNVADTVFEAGSVSKQFTAASILLLARDGRLSLTDDVRKYIPELPDYGTPITLNMLLSHTSGLRDWGNLEGLAGWPRTDRVYSLNDVLEITARQSALNYTPGSAWSYTNTGYNLLAIIVERVSGQALPAFSHDHLFAPLGMTHTQWRDDFRRIVPGRAIAYEKTRGGYEQLMPFENAIGNGGLLTTVGDLLIWNRALTEGKLGPFVTTELQRPAKLSDGRETSYARGLFIDSYRGAPEISHSGATAGYRAWLGRYPTKGLSVAMLCNADDADTRLAYSVIDLFLGEARTPPPNAPSPKTPTPEPLTKWSGWYRNDRTGAALHLITDGDVVKTDFGAVLARGPKGDFRLGRKPVTLLADGRIGFPSNGETITYSPAPAYSPSQADLQAIVGRYHSAEAAADYLISMEGGALLMRVVDRADSAERLVPTYAGAFSWSGGEVAVRLLQAADGHVTGLRLSDDRVWDLRANRVE